MASNRTCPDPQTLQAFVKGNLDDEDAVALVDHLDQCTTCNAAVAKLESDANSIIQGLRFSPPESSAEQKPNYCDEAELGYAVGRLCSSSPSTAVLEGTVALQSSEAGNCGAPGSADTPGNVERIGDYELLEEIARGGMGVVYKARQVSLNRIVALKTILAGQFASESEVARFRTEAQAAANLDHPALVPIYEVGQAEGRYFYSMAFVDGTSLASRLAEGPLQPRDAAVLLAVIADAIHYAHLQGLIHRDLKPANILLRQGLESSGKNQENGSRSRQSTLDLQPLVTDFGLAKRFETDSGLTVTGQVMGTPSYMSPEQASGRAEAIGPASDVYALGSVMYAMLTGHPPFRSASVADTLRQVAEAEPVALRTLNQSLPRDLETICMKCLRKDPQRRYSDAAELAQDLRRWLNHLPIQARPTGKVERVWLWCKRRPSVAALLLLLLLTVVAGTVAMAEGRFRLKSAALVDQVMTAEIDEVPALVEQLSPYRRIADDAIHKELVTAEHGDNDRRQLRARLALLPVDDGQVLILQQHMLTAEPKDFQVICKALDSHDDDLRAPLLDILGDRERPSGERFRAACALAHFAPDDIRWHDYRPFLVDQLISVFPSELEVWRAVLAPAKSRLTEDLKCVVLDPQRNEQERWFATVVLQAYQLNDLDLQFTLLINASPGQFRTLLQRLDYIRGPIIARSIKLLLGHYHFGTDWERNNLGKLQANAAAALILSGNPDGWRVLNYSSNPEARSGFIHTAAKLRIPFADLAAQLDKETDTSIINGLLLCMGEYDPLMIPAVHKSQVLTRLRRMYHHEANAALHSTAEWLLRRWDEQITLAEVDERYRLDRAEHSANWKANTGRWFINSQGHELVVLDAGTFRMGSRATDRRQQVGEDLHVRRIGRIFAIGAKEVTLEQFNRFSANNPDVFQFSTPKFREQGLEMMRRASFSPQGPQVGITWYEAAAYCNWLSEQEGIKPSQWCYERNADGEYRAGMKAKKDCLKLAGYRLPTEAEWEFACRAGTDSRYYFGTDDTMLPHYARYQDNSEGHAWPVGLRKPNEFGLFDMYGNVAEWCHDRLEAYPFSVFLWPKSDDSDSRPVEDNIQMVLRGGGWSTRREDVYSSYRGFVTPPFRYGLVGFRIARTLSE